MNSCQFGFRISGCNLLRSQLLLLHELTVADRSVAVLDGDLVAGPKVGAHNGLWR